MSGWSGAGGEPRVPYRVTDGLLGNLYDAGVTSTYCYVLCGGYAELTKLDVNLYPRMKQESDMFMSAWGI